MKRITIAIDGPAGAGKSTVAKLLASELHFIYIDSGAMYRALAYTLLDNKVDFSNGSSLFSFISSVDIAWKIVANQQLIFVNGVDVTTRLRTPLVDKYVSSVAELPEVRKYLASKQKDYGCDGGVVMDGRDIGTVIFPNAEIKFFLVASVEERARRRYEENLQKGINCDFALLLEQISRRDQKDISRQLAPLKKAPDAIEINTTNLQISEVVSLMLRHIYKRTEQ